MKILNQLWKNTDWIVFFSSLFLSIFGILTMYSFNSEEFFHKQILWLLLSILVFFVSSMIDWRSFRKTEIVMFFYFFSIGLLSFLFLAGSVFKGAKSWFDFGLFSFQPVDMAKISVILILSKYFSRRHIEIGHIRHILVSGFYALVVFSLIFLQPDFGGSIIIFLIWFGMVMISGISKKHLLIVFIVGAISFMFLWNFAFRNYQKERIVNFINPLKDIRGGGYNVYQSVVAVGSGGLLGKGVGYGTQSKLEFLPEYQTDFIFGAFAEEWGFVGVSLIFFLFLILLKRIISVSSRSETNFEILFGSGIFIMLMSHIVLNIGMNLGLLPVTGNTLPFMSYGGSHLISEFFALGIISSMGKYKRAIHKEHISNEMVGVI